ncbi:hypothetical protein [Paenibacillus flagellatus]|uniref:Histidine kinase N-terminal 7TM region domain-containing protein n=1 Tax=Paenibacillus flagellatus TaxID=2211139 RepID=A0A2V5KSD0_9BACL|nr:hypothetical protein [Paenibacillus flagellatus]PYI51926.1 hypothetical protein DLM86_23755 [Paenibacillus flagellatus]
MIAIVLMYGAITVFELAFLRRNGRKARTYRIVLGMMAVSFAYNAVSHFFPGRLSPNRALEAIFGPIQRWFS